MLTNEQVRGLIEYLVEQKFDVTMSDISYVALCRFYKDRKLAYKVLFHNENDLPFDMYDRSEKIVAIENYLDDNLKEGKSVSDTKQSDDNTITFDELKKGLIDDMNALIEIRDSTDEDGRSALEPKEMAQIVKNISDIRLRLTQHFGATQKEESQRIVVTSKYTRICPNCGREC